MGLKKEGASLMEVLIKRKKVRSSRNWSIEIRVLHFQVARPI